MVEIGQATEALPDEIAAGIPTGELLALVAFFCFILWDAYIPAGGIRPLDLLGSVVLSVGLCSREVRHHASSAVRYAIPILCLGVVCAAMGGVLGDTANTRAGIGICAGAMVFVLFTFWPISAAGLLRVVTTALVVNLLAFWLQFAWYRATGTVLNFYAFLGAQPRVLGSIFRAAGLYLEPASFALMSFSLLALRVYVSDRFGLIFWVTIGSMCASLSLWGILSAAILAALYVIRRSNGVVLVVCAAVATVAAAVALQYSDLWRQLWLIHRLSNIAADPSANIRYAGLLHFRSSDLWKSAFWFGGGVRINYEGFGANGLSYLLTSVGLLGSLALGVCVGLRARPGWRLYAVVVFAVLLTAAYLWTFMYWWSLLALLGRADIVALRLDGARSVNGSSGPPTGASER